MLMIRQSLGTYSKVNGRTYHSTERERMGNGPIIIPCTAVGRSLVLSETIFSILFCSHRKLHGMEIANNDPKCSTFSGTYRVGATFEDVVQSGILSLRAHKNREPNLLHCCCTCNVANQIHPQRSMFLPWPGLFAHSVGRSSYLKSICIDKYE